jgi:8-amino-7-oxononanoate synthase
LGLRPRAAIGTSIGATVAAAARGGLDAKTALQLVAEHSLNALQRSPVTSYDTLRKEQDGDMPTTIRALQSSGISLFVEIGRDDDFADSARSVLKDTGDFIQVLSLPTDGECPASGFLQVIGRLVIQGISLDLTSLYRAAKPVSLPSAPLLTRTFWVADATRRSERSRIGPHASKNNTNGTLGTATQTQAAAQSSDLSPGGHGPTGPRLFSEPQAAELAKLNPEVDFVTPGALLSPSQIRQRVIQLIAEASAYPIEKIVPGQRLGDDLGVDSLMGVDLYLRLTEAFAEVRELPQAMIGGETTIEELAGSVVALVARAKGTRSRTAKDQEIARYTVAITDRPLSTSKGRRALPFMGRILLVADRLGVASHLARRLVREGRSVNIVSPDYPLNIGRDTAITDLSALDQTSSVVDASLLRKSVLALLRRIAEIGAGGLTPTAFVVAHSGIGSAGLAGMIKAKAREWPKSLMKAVEIAPGMPAYLIAETVFEELNGSSQDIEVSYVTGQRRVPVLRRSDLDARPLQDSAVVVISGGGRGLGAKLAVELARRGKARLLLLGRSPSAEGTIASVRAAGGDAFYIQCDVRHIGQVHDAFRECRQAFGPIDYIVHSAGVLVDIAENGSDHIAAIFDTKVAGALAMWDAARPDPLKSFLIYGSWAGRFGNANQLEYSAANHTLGNLAALLGSERPDARVVTVDLPPWEGSGMVNAMSEEARSALRKRVRFLTDDAGMANVIAELSAVAESGEVVLGAGLDDETLADRVFLPFSTHEYPWFDDHRIEGKVIAPFAFLLDQAAAAAGRLGLGPSLALSNAQMLGDAAPSTGSACWLDLTANASRSQAEIEVNLIEEGSRLPLMRVSAATAPSALPLLTRPSDGTTPRLSLVEFYEQRTFHGPRLRGLESIAEIGSRHVVGRLDSGAVGGVGGAALDILSLDTMLQLGAYWSSVTTGRIALPVSAREVHVLAPPRVNVPADIVGILEDASDEFLIANFDLVDSEGSPLVQIRGLRCRFMVRQDPALSQEIDPARWQIDRFPEVIALRGRIENTQHSGLNPYFSVHEMVSNDISVIRGQEYVNFASYNYLGLSGDAEVTAHAMKALQRYGTSVSASRLASGEKPLHQELEHEIAEFLGCEDAIVMVGGHATNVSVIGHLFGPQDLVVHDTLAHDSILAGIKLAGAKRRAFPHNDLDALDNILRQSRTAARRVLIAIEGVYSMDGDMPALDAIIGIKRRHHALLLVDEAHSLGVIGNTGRGIGEHCAVNREDVDLWMGTLSKALASCGGYIAGSAELVRYLKYSNPGFVYSVGISPANAAAALAALRKLRDHPELVTTLRERSRLFCDLSRKYGIDTGFSEGTAIVPCIVGNSVNCMLLGSALAERRINVQPILYPAVEERLTRLRFFVTARHSEQQISTSVTALAEALREISPNLLRNSAENSRGADSLRGG